MRANRGLKGNAVKHYSKRIRWFQNRRQDGTTSSVMSSESVEDRIMELEQNVRQLESNARPDMNALPWWECVAGEFKDDQVYAAARKPGAEIRKADQPEIKAE